MSLLGQSLPRTRPGQAVTLLWYALVVWVVARMRRATGARAGPSASAVSSWPRCTTTASGWATRSTIPCA